jgi:hypothetical protein
MTHTEALKMALETLERSVSTCFTPFAYEEVMCRRHHFVNETITALKEALAQPEQEPVAWATREDFYRELDRLVNRMRQQMEIKSVIMRCKDYDVALPIIYTDFGRVLVGQVSIPPQRTWVGLTDEEHIALHDKFVDTDCYGLLIDATEAKLKEKNYHD